MSGEPRCPLGAITGRQPTDTSLLQPASKAKCSAAAETDRGRPKSLAPFEVCCDCPVAHAVDAPALAIRPPCDRPRCRARRLALRLARRDAAAAYARLVLRAWSCHAKLERQRHERRDEREQHAQTQRQWQRKQQQWQLQQQEQQALLQQQLGRHETRLLELRRDARRERKEEQREPRRQEQRATRDQERNRLLDGRQRRWHDGTLDAVLLERRARRTPSLAEAEAESRSRRASAASAPLGPGRLMWRLVNGVAFAGALCSRWGGGHPGDHNAS